MGVESHIALVTAGGVSRRLVQRQQEIQGQSLLTHPILHGILDTSGRTHSLEIKRRRSLGDLAGVTF